ncbi:LysR family transcriptional regulator [Paraburkholderia tropica]|uniref:LysR family transcriptional regulator n=1 Tax=Paraburkholderia tropica TaxID=92647 RepID=UPI002AB797AF|nr:LysR family transcriptional regulator [Paraburkholderia tropica]
MDRSQEMAAFVAVVDAGSFIGAVDTLRISKAAVSRYVDALEQRIGVRLLHRTTRRLSLTEEGRIFYQRARDILEAIDNAEAEVSSRILVPGGLVRVNVPLSFGMSHLAPLWGDFMVAFPQIDLDVTLNDRVVDLVDEGYDLAVRISSLPDSSMVCRKLAVTEMVACASPGYLASHDTPDHPQQLTRHRVLAYTYFAGRDEWRFYGPEGEVVVRTQARVYSNNGDTCRTIALRDGGIILQPSFMVSEDLKRGDLVRLMPNYRSVELGIYAVYPSRKQLPLKVRCLVDFLAGAFRVSPWGRPGRR